MKSIRLILVLWLGTSVWAQVLPPNQRVTPPLATKPNAARTASSVTSPKPSATATTTTTAPRSVKNGRRVNATASSSSRRHDRKVSQPSSPKAALAAGGESVPIAHKGRRDPFVSPVVDHVRVASGCIGSGKKCLVIGEISLQGVVHSPGGFIAVVMNGEHTYFLRERDPLADGSVERITKDTIILREHSSDILGRRITRDVTKRLGVPSV